ncbi:hypothetical protein ACJMK2_018790 [Sinanodonta woodiana]|uniref:BTB domain-containing protein n=1 Tax=Sinanodonta woodiana TaxID=1069815 RepID=A0ABD3UEF8_SINWO
MEINTTLPVGWQSEFSLTESIYTMFEKELWTDVNFILKTKEDRVEVKAHRLVLAARSPVFQAMFYGRMATNGKVTIEDISPDTFKLFLRYLYIDDEEINEESAWHVIEVAHKYQVGFLVNRCADVLSSSITVDNACETLQCAVFYNLKTLKKITLGFIDDNAAKVLETPEFMELPNETLTLILSGDTFKVDEMKIIEKMVEWASKKCTEQGIELNGINMRKILGDTFFHLRLPTLSLSDFTEHVGKAGFLTEKEELAIYRHMGSPSSQNGVCTSIIPRVPRRCYYDLITKHLSYYASAKTLTTTITINCFKYMFLTGINYEANITQSSDIDGSNLSVFKATISIPRLNINLIYEKNGEGSTTKCIKFENSIPLTMKNGPYEMILQVTWMNDHKAKYPSSSYVQGESLSVDSNAKDVCSFTYNDKFRFIKGLRFLRPSNRKNV